MKSVIARVVAVWIIHSYNLDYDLKYKRARAIGSGDSHVFFAPISSYECVFFFVVPTHRSQLHSGPRVNGQWARDSV